MHPPRLGIRTLSLYGFGLLILGALVSGIAVAYLVFDYSAIVERKDKVDELYRAGLALKYHTERLLTTAEQHLRGELTWDELRAKDTRLGGSLSAACLIGVFKCHDPSAATRLVYGATHNPYPAIGAREAARWMRAFHILMGRRYNLPADQVEDKVQSTSRLQVITLTIIANWHRLKREKGG